MQVGSQKKLSKCCTSKHLKVCSYWSAFGGVVSLPDHTTHAVVLYIKSHGCQFKQRITQRRDINVSTWSNRKPSKVPNPDNVNLQRRLVNVGTSSNCKPYKPDSLNWCQLNIPAGGVEIKLCSILMNLWFQNLFPSLSTVSFSCEGPGPGGGWIWSDQKPLPKA
jgi:hypothetical protein